MHLFLMHYGIKVLENFFKSFLKFTYLLIMGIILEQIHDLIKVGPKYFSMFVHWFNLQISARSLDVENLFALEFGKQNHCKKSNIKKSALSRIL